MKDRKTLTKSLHTVTVVSRVANQIMTRAFLDNAQAMGPTDATRAALELVGTSSDWDANDETFKRCVEALKKLRGL